MGYTTLPNSGLRTWPYGESGWLTHFNYNWDRLNYTLLRVAGMLDINLAGIADGDIFQWDAGSSKWVPKTPLWSAIGITTTTTV